MYSEVGGKHAVRTVDNGTLASFLSADSKIGQYFTITADGASACYMHNGEWKDTIRLASQKDLNNYAQKNFTPASGNWENGIRNAYFKMEKHLGDNFSPFLKMPTDNGAWVIGTHSISNQLIFRYYANETGDGVSVYKFTPNATSKEV